jgi:hypothetical protein
MDVSTDPLSSACPDATPAAYTRPSSIAKRRGRRTAERGGAAGREEEEEEVSIAPARITRTFGPALPIITFLLSFGLPRLP